MSTEPAKKKNLNSQFAILNSYLARPIRVFVLLAAVVAVPLQVRGDNSPVIRLLQGEGLPRAVISGSSLNVEKQVNGTFRPVIGKIRMVGLSLGSGGIHLDGSDAVAEVFRVIPEKGMLRYAGSLHRGYITARLNGGKLMVVSHLPMESYLIGVVNGEIDSSWPLDAVKAQVVAARSYALHRINTGSLYYDLKTDVTDQVYAGVESEDERAVKAVEMTHGEVLYKDGNVIQAFFHSSCGGNTTSAAEVWGVRHAAQNGVYCGECEEAPYAHWNLAPDSGELVRAIRSLHPRAEKIRTLGIHKRTRDGRAQTLFVDTGKGRVLIDAGEFRKEMGYRRLPSTRFSLGTSGERIVLTGEGYGHGVGLCQWGARGSALRGMNYRQILRKYYPGAEVRRAY